MRSITVCVEYDDFLAITLPRNRRHFDHTLVVTSPADARTRAVAKSHGCEVYTTDVFYAGGAHFNKGAAMEEGFDVLGRKGWIVVWDADIVMPGHLWQPTDKNCLYTPARRILEDPRQFSDDLDWTTLRNASNPNEFAGYFQMFHASTPCLQLPWYSVDWIHAGGCDSDFQFQFPPENLRRPPFEVLHLGAEIREPTVKQSQNWCGRTTPRIDTGEAPADAQKRRQQMVAIFAERKLDRERLGAKE